VWWAWEWEDWAAIEVPARPPIYPNRFTLLSSNVVICRLTVHSCETINISVQTSCNVAQMAIDSVNVSYAASRQNVVEIEQEAGRFLGSIAASSGADEKSFQPKIYQQ